MQFFWRNIADQFTGPKLFWFGSLFSCLVGVMVLKIIIPVYFPQLDGGMGLLINTDSVEHHALAVEKMWEMRTQGFFSAVELRPNLQGNVFFASIVYHFFGPDPVYLMPLHGLLRGWSGLIIFRLLFSAGADRVGALVGAFAFLFMPTHLASSSQLLKDVWVTPFLFAFPLLLLRGFREPQKLWIFFFEFAVAALIAWIIRPYLLNLVGFAGVFMVASVLLFWSGKFKVISKKGVAGLILTFLALTMVKGETFVSLFPGGREDAPFGMEKEFVQVEWQYSDWIPDFIESPFRRLALVRERFVFTGGLSLIDDAVKLKSISDFFKYGPSAVWSALVAPTPWFLWGGEGNVTQGNLRMLCLPEMILYYLSIIYLFVIFFRVKMRRLAIFLSAGGLFLVSIIYFIAIPNLGTFYRMRLPMQAILIGLGVALAFEHLARTAASKRPTDDTASSAARLSAP